MIKGLRAFYDFSCVAVRGLWKGVKNVLSPEHWQEMVTGTLQLGLLFLDAVGREEAGQDAVLVAALSRNYDVIPKLAEEYCLHTQAQKDAISCGVQETYKKIKAMSWPELVENGFELGTTIILDIVAWNVLSGLTKASGRAAIKQISNVMKKGSAATEWYAVEVAGFGKLLIEEGPEAVIKATDVIKECPNLAASQGRNVAKKVYEIDKLLEAGNMLDKGGLTAIGRALQRHGSRTESVFPRTTGNTAAINIQGETVLKEILINSNVTPVIRHHARFGDILEYRISGGMGARFSSNGKIFIKIEQKTPGF